MFDPSLPSPPGPLARRQTGSAQLAYVAPEAARTAAFAPAASRDALWRGRLPLWQPARGQGYRFNLDSVLLAGFVAPTPGGHAVELGAGCGIIGMVLLAAGKVASLTAVERQIQLSALLARNVAAYGWHHRVALLAGDLRHLALPPADLVVFNPPYFAAAASRACPEPGRDAGRRECFGTLEDFVLHGAAALRPNGELVAILPYGRRAALYAALAQAGLRVQRQRVVHARSDAPPRHLMVAARRAKAPGAATAAMTLPPLVVHQLRGGYTAEVAALIEGPPAWRGPPGGDAGPRPSAG